MVPHGLLPFALLRRWQFPNRRSVHKSGNKVFPWPPEIRRENARDKRCDFHNGYHFRPSRQCRRIDQCRLNFVQLLTTTSSTAGVFISSK